MAGVLRVPALARRAASPAAVVLLLVAAPAARAQIASATEPAASGAELAPGQVRELLVLLADPAVRDWITRQAGGGPPAESAPPPPRPEAAAGEATAGGAAGADTAHAQVYIGRSVEALRARLRGLAQAAPTIPDELLRAAATFRSEIAEHGLALTSLLVAVFAALGFGTEWLF